MYPGKGAKVFCLSSAANTGVKGVFQLLLLPGRLLVLESMFGEEFIYKGQEVEQIRGLS